MNHTKNIITRKIKYTVNPDNTKLIKKYIINYNNILRFTFNRLQENNKITTKELSSLQRQLKNITLDTHFQNSAIYDAKILISISKNNKVLFGGKKLFIQRCQNKITKEEWQEKRLHPLCSIGQAPSKSNRKFRIINTQEICFRPNKNTYINLIYQNKVRRL